MNNSTNEVTIYHNPRCSKSRQTLALLEAQGIQPKIILYLENPPSTEKLKQLLKSLNMSARELIRKGESIYKTQNLHDERRSTAELLSAMCTNPILIERPIVECNNRACIGRPPESVLTLL